MSVLVWLDSVMAHQITVGNWLCWKLGWTAAAFVLTAWRDMRR